MRELNERENKVLDLTAQLWNAILELEELHPHDNSEHMRDIHNIQNRILARSYYEKLRYLYKTHK